MTCTCSIWTQLHVHRCMCVRNKLDPRKSSHMQGSRFENAVMSTETLHKKPTLDSSAP